MFLLAALATAFAVSTYAVEVPEKSGDAPATIERSAEADSFAIGLDRAIWADLAGMGGLDSSHAPPFDLSSVLESLAPSDAILALHPEGGERIRSLVLTAKGPIVAELDAPSTPWMAARVHAWMRDPGGARLDRHALRSLHQELIEPWRAALRPVVRLVVVPSGSLRGIPFELLLMADAEGDESATLPVLALRHEITYEPTLGSRLLWTKRPASSPVTSVRVVGHEPHDSQPSVSPGVLIASGGLDPARRFARALEWARSGARGALLGWGDADLETLVHVFDEGSAGGRRSDASVVRAFYASVAPDSALGPMERRARISLFGSP